MPGPESFRRLPESTLHSPREPGQPYTPLERREDKETIPSLPGLERHMYITTPFRAYESLDNAMFHRETYHMRTFTPATYTVLESSADDHFVRLRSTDTAEELWVNTEECSCSEWSLPYTLLTEERSNSSMRVSASLSSDDSGLSIPTPKNTVYPLLDTTLREDGWRRVAPALTDQPGKTTPIQRELWIHERDTNERRVLNTGIVLPKAALQKLQSTLRFLQESAQADFPQKNETSLNALLQGSKIAYLHALGIADASKDNADTIVAALPDAPSFCTLSIDELLRLDQEQYKEWLNLLEASVRFIDNADTIEHYHDDTKQMMYRIPLTALP